MPGIEINIEVYCAECGLGLCDQTESSPIHGKPSLHIHPCKGCLEAAQDKGYEEGHNAGYALAEEDHAAGENE